MTGLGYARGEKVFIANCDLEDAPENLGTFYHKLAESPDSDVIYGMQVIRKGGFCNQIFGKLFYKLLNAMSDLNLDNKMAFSRLMTRRYVKSLLRYKESELFLAGLWHLTGYKQSAVTISSHYKGKSSYTFRKKLLLLVNAVTSFSEKPLIYIFVTGLVISFLAGAFSLYLILQKLFFNTPLLGWSSLMVSLWLIGGLSILFMGIIGMYLSKVFIETKRRPYSIIKKIYTTRYKRGDREKNA